MEHYCNKESDINEIKSDVKQILKILNGNGTIGMCGKVEILWQKLDRIQVILWGTVGVVISKLAWEFISKR